MGEEERGEEGRHWDMPVCLVGVGECSCVSDNHTRNSQAGLTSEDILSDVGLGPSCHSGGAEGSLGVTGGWGWEGMGALAYTYRA